MATGVIIGEVCDCGANVRRGWWQTLLVDLGCGGVLGLLSGWDGHTQGRLAKARLTLGYVPQPLWGWWRCGGGRPKGAMVLLGGEPWVKGQRSP